MSKQKVLKDLTDSDPFCSGDSVQLLDPYFDLQSVAEPIGQVVALSNQPSRQLNGLGDVLTLLQLLEL